MKVDLKIAAVILIIFGVVIGFVIIAGDTIGLDDADARTLASVLPGVFVLLGAFWVTTQASGYMLSGAVAGVGLSLAFLIHLMNEATLLIPDLEMSASDLSLTVIVVFLVIAAGLAVRER